jgi:hypothetical protein
MLVTVSSVAGAPGATSWALLLAAAWPAGGAPCRVVVEADCAGGVLGARYRVGVDPGAMTLISACRRDDGSALEAADHGRRLADGLWLVPGPEVADHAVAAWSSGAGDVAHRLVDDPRLWVVDGGRIGPESPLRPLTEAAVVNLVVSRPEVEDLLRLPGRLVTLGGTSMAAALLCGRPAQDRRELHRFLGGAPVWIAPRSDRLPQVAGAAVGGGLARRGPVWRAAVELAAELATLVARPPDAADPARRSGRARPWPPPENRSRPEGGESEP